MLYTNLKKKTTTNIPNNKIILGEHQKFNTTTLINQR